MVRGPWVSQNELVVVPLRLLLREAAVVVVVEGYAKSVALASDTVSRVWVDMTSRVVGVNP